MEKPIEYPELTICTIISPTLSLLLISDKVDISLRFIALHELSELKKSQSGYVLFPSF